MTPLPPPTPTLSAAAAAIRSGRLRALDLVEACLVQVDAWEPRVHAWVELDPEGAKRQARQLDAELVGGLYRGPLHGIPMGVKDIIDVAGFATRAGSPDPLRQEPAARDAPLVARLRQAGAIIFGKTATTPFAWLDPPPTRNPWNLGRTPGGSSSGSAAAVASGMCLAALGTQTGGSIIRPASFCGVAGLKPSFGILETMGIVPLAPSLDHPGAIARTAADLWLVFDALRDPERPLAAERLSPRSLGCGIPRLGVVRGFLSSLVEPEMSERLGEFCAGLESRGGCLIELEIDLDIAAILADCRTILAAEAAAEHRRLQAMSPAAFPPQITALIAEGKEVFAADYLEARRRQNAASQQAAAVFDSLEVLATPAARGPAPPTATTGDPSLNAPWSFLGLPTVCIPIGRSADGMPLGVQLIGRPGGDLDLLSVAAWCEATDSQASGKRAAD